MGWEVIIFLGVAILFFAVGLVGIVFPLLPGIPLIWLGALIYAFFTDFREVGWLVMTVFTVLTIFSFVIDYLANIYGAKKFGAGRWGIAGSILGMMIGIITGGLVGLIVGPIIGATIGELISGKDHRRALKAGLGTFIGFLSGTLIKFIIGLLMIGLFFWQLF
ncbi:MAG: DUF456 domain-containing protein [Patescibacteria group bacterium]|jgi:hypothetical protein